MDDLQTIIPYKRFDKYTGSEVYIIPCIVIEYEELINKSARNIKIKRIDFDSGNIITSEAITFEKSIKSFIDTGITPPFITECKIVKKEFEIDYIVYGKFNTSGFVNKLLGFNQNLTAIEKTSYCKENYKLLKEWLVQKV